ncbi:MAG TPA: hypothetical protein VNI61_09465 [Gemmatimonadales bacterium]|nr:hypothetical protein [Gemmatimonadales bacterium]
MSIPLQGSWHVWKCATLTMFVVVLGRHSLTAQVPAWTLAPWLGGEEENRERLSHLLGGGGKAEFLLRSPSTSLDRLATSAGSRQLTLLAPEILLVHNSAMPFSLNDGALWAGRGWSQRLRGGIQAKWGRVRLTLAPEFIATENLWYELPPPQVRLPQSADRSPFANPWHVGDYSIDAPLRFGERGLRFLDLGQSTLAVDVGAVVVGLSTENEWWGPGIRNALVMSSHAAGIPRAVVRTARPLRTPVGTVSGRWMLGGLFESDYFDASGLNDRRSLNAIAGSWTPPGVPDLTLGITRAVYAPLTRWSDVFAHGLDVLRDRGRRVPPNDSTPRPARDQILSLFGRWVFPRDGFAVHFEWARTDPPRSLRDLLVDPSHSQGYTLGLEWARAVRDGRGAVRLQAEVTYLENSPSSRHRREPSFYTGAATPQGYTHRGQVVGAGIGQGASSQWIGLDYFAPTWRVGLFGGRIRWDDDALYSFEGFYANKWCAHDVSLFGGIAAALATPIGRLEGTLAQGQRLNVFFYHLTWCGPTAAPIDILDVTNTTLELRWSVSP